MKRFYPFLRIFLIPPFGEIVVIITQIGKTLIDLTNLFKLNLLLSSYLFVYYSSYSYSVFNEHNRNAHAFLFLKFNLMASPSLCFRKDVKLSSIPIILVYGLVGSNSNHSPTYRVLYAVHWSASVWSLRLASLGGLKWTRTTDLALIRRAL